MDSVQTRKGSSDKTGLTPSARISDNETASESETSVYLRKDSDIACSL